MVYESLLKNKFDASDSSIKKIVCTGEGILTKDLERNASGKQLEQRFGAEVYASYSVTELSISYGECTERCGTHAHPELVYTEIVDEHGYPVPDGEIGELVATPLGVEGVPLVRYRTGDITFKVPGTCVCGRNSFRLGPILNRESSTEPVDAVKHDYASFSYNGTVVEPGALIEALASVYEVKDFIIIVESDSGTADSATIQVAAPPAALAAINQAVKAATDVFIPVLISNIPTIQSLRDGSKERIPLVDNRRRAAVGQR